jgi:hypothetical protein
MQPYEGSKVNSKVKAAVSDDTLSVKQGNNGAMRDSDEINKQDSYTMHAFVIILIHGGRINSNVFQRDIGKHIGLIQI